MISLSKAKLEYSGGMHLTTCAQQEIQVGNDWFRLECFTDDAGKLRYEGFTRIGVYWKRVLTDDDVRDKQTGILATMHALGNRLLQRARIASGELQLT